MLCHLAGQTGINWLLNFLKQPFCLVAPGDLQRASGWASLSSNMCEITAHELLNEGLFLRILEGVYQRKNGFKKTIITNKRIHWFPFLVQFLVPDNKRG
jgi:hypothetical protein